MIEQVCAYIHNYFVYARYSGTFSIEGGSISLPFLADGQYFRICGSRLNDGVYQYPAFGLTDETFSGVIWEMRVPRLFLDLVSEISDWQEKNGDIVASPYTSESFGGYSYTLATGTNADGTTASAGWQNTFKERLNPYRKLA